MSGTAHSVSLAESNRSQPLARALLTHRRALAVLLMRNLAGSAKFNDVLRDPTLDVEQFLNRHTYAFIDFLRLYFSSGDAAYKQMYVGEKIKLLYDPNLSEAEAHELTIAITAADANAIVAHLRNELAKSDLDKLQHELASIHSVLTARANHTLEVLFVGDCIFQDLIAFFTTPCLESGISIQPSFVNTGSPVDARNALRDLAGRRFDVVFYSPFSYEFDPSFAQLLRWGSSLWPPARLNALADEAIDNFTATASLISQLFDCPIFLHNSAVVRRHENTIPDIVRLGLTSHVRRSIRQRINRRVADFIVEHNSATGRHMVLIDEATLLHTHSERRLGRFLHFSLWAHAAMLGKLLAAQYHDILEVMAHLRTKKLVVCDLDDTLWRGVIGEGAVEHCYDRQAILKRLREKGVVLAVNSHNDPRRVHWKGCLLNEDDFVSMQINWDSKSANMQRIRKTLDLKLKDAIFIDDRADERELMRLAIPELHTMDATNPRTWRLLDLWSRLLRTPVADSSTGETGGGAMDRTLMYKQRALRNSFIEAAQLEHEDRSAYFAKLGLTVAIRPAGPADLPRVAELINRTNQFNLCGSRTSVRELQECMSAGDHRILIASAADKFGSMGDVCAAVLQMTPRDLRIAMFVLSCRVFGYDIEHAMLNCIRRLARHGSPRDKPLTIIGCYQETPHNQPCRSMYPRSGFHWNGKHWIRRDADEPVDPPWLSITWLGEPLNTPADISSQPEAVTG